MLHTCGRVAARRVAARCLTPHTVPVHSLRTLSTATCRRAAANTNTNATAATSEDAATTANTAPPAPPKFAVSATSPTMGSSVNGMPTLDLPNDPRMEDIESLRAAAGLPDPMSPDFRWNVKSRARWFWRFGLLVGIPLALYHLNATVRNWANDQIDAYQQRQAQQKPAAAAASTKPEDKKSIIPVARAEGKQEATPAASKLSAAPATTGEVTKKEAATFDKLAKVATTPEATAAAAATAINKADMSKKEVEQSAELILLLQLLDQANELLKHERDERAVVEANRPVVIPPPVFTELPASAALRQVKDLMVNLQLPALPTPPRWAMPPATEAEARQRIEAITQFKIDHEAAVAETITMLRKQLANELTPALQAAYNRASAQFEQELPERLRQAKVATQQLLERTRLEEHAAVSIEIAQKKANEWKEILTREVEKQKRDLERATRDVLDKQARTLTKEYDPSVQEQLNRLEQQRQDIIALEKELLRKKKIEKMGERVHALTSLLIRMEENLHRDTKAQLFDAQGRVIPSPAAPTWARDLERDWARMWQLSAEDPALRKLMSAVPTEYVSPDSETPLASPSALRHAYARVEKSVRQATFLPPGEERATETNPLAMLYAKAFATLAMKEGQALRPHATTDVDRLNNATYYVQKERNLAAACAELEALESPKARAEAADWLHAARQRVLVERTVANIRQNIDQTAKTYAKKF